MKRKVGTAIEQDLLRRAKRKAMDQGRPQERYGILTNDALILAVSLRLRADALVSGDKALRPVTEIMVHPPTDVRR